jgi:hypothetical protein
MKRWLIGSLACNLLLLGIGAGFLVGGFLRPGPLPPLGPRPGIQRDLMSAVENGLTGPEREQAMEIVRRNSDDFAKPPPGPRPDELLARFVAGDVPKLQDFLDPGFEQRRRREAENLRKIFAELADILEEPERKALADALQKRVDTVRACLDAGAMPPR